MRFLTLLPARFAVAVAHLAVSGPAGDTPPFASFFGFRSQTSIFFWFRFRLFWGEQPPLIPARVWGAVIFSYLFIRVVCRSCGVGDTEEHLTPALNVLFWDQVVEANQFVSCALALFIS